MASTVPAKQFVRSYIEYAELLEALGYEVVAENVLRRVAGSCRDKDCLSRLLDAHRRGSLNGEHIEAGILSRMNELRESLRRVIGSEAGRLAGHSGGNPSGRSMDLIDLISGLDPDKRDELADMVLLNEEHRDAVARRTISVAEFHALLREFANDQTIARKKLIEHIRREFLKRGIDMSCETIEERFRPSPHVRTMPYCIKRIFKGLNGQFRTGLVPLEHLVGHEDADEWLKRAQRQLKFRSQSAMHRAIAEQTGLSYDSIHKALSGKRKAQRIQAQIKECLHDWLRRAEQGEDLGAADGHRGVPVEKMCALLPDLQAIFRTKENIYRAISERTGIRTASIRRYFQNDGKLKSAPLSVYRTAQALREEKPAIPEPPRKAARRNPPRRKPTHEELIAEQARRAFVRWQQDKANPELERKFKHARRTLIAYLRERRLRALLKTACV
jgi:hypothetical protein